MGLLDRFKKKQQQERLASLGKGAKKNVASTPAGKVEEKSEKRSVKQDERKAEHGKPKPIARSTTAQKVLVRPIVTEKATMLGANSQYVFAVTRQATKTTIKRAIRELYGVTPISIRIIQQPGKAVQYGRTWGRTKHWKKAIIGLKHGETITVTEGAV